MKWTKENIFDNFGKIRREIPELKLFGEKPLHTPSTDVDLKEGLQIVTELTKAINKYREVTGLGRGIAAPQIGIAKNVFITFEVDEKINVYINPVITNYSKETNFYRELCMSSGLLWADIERPSSISMKWTDETGAEQEGDFGAPVARLLQHEYDHLQGCVCLDKAIPKTISFVYSNPADEKTRDSKITT